VRNDLKRRSPRLGKSILTPNPLRREEGICHPHPKEYFTAVLSGDPFNFDGYGGVDKVEQRDGTKIYYLKKFKK